MKTSFSDRGLTFTPFESPGEPFLSEYNGHTYETWKVNLSKRSDDVIGIFRFKKGTYKTRKELSASFEGEREKYGVLNQNDSDHR